MTALTRPLVTLMAVGAMSIISLPAFAMPILSAKSGQPLVQTNWSDRVRGRTSSSTPALGYGWLWGDDDVGPRYRHAPRRYDPDGYDRSAPAPYGYDESAY